MDREQLLERENEAWSELVATLAAVPSDRREVEGVVPGWSAHDLAWHSAYWAAYAGDVLERLERGEPEPTQPEDEEAWDAEIVSTGRGMSWDEVLRQLALNHERVRAAFSAFGDPPPEAVQWFTDDTFDHYEEHAAQIRAFAS